jgi:hypothetical protein
MLSSSSSSRNSITLLTKRGSTLTSNSISLSRSSWVHISARRLTILSFVYYLSSRRFRRKPTDGTEDIPVLFCCSMETILSIFALNKW